MTTATHAPLDYGQFKRPAEEKHFDSIQDPVALASALFKQWLPITSSSSVRKGSAYAEAYRLISPHSEAFGSLGESGLEQVLQMVEQSHVEFSGYFISAFHNATPISTIGRAFPESCNGVGYLLETGKTLVVEQGSQISFAGELAKGTIINHRTLERLRNNSLTLNGAVGAVLINFGSLREVGGIQNSFILNFGEVQSFRNCAHSLALNFGTTFEFGYASAGSIAINYGEARRMGVYCKNSILVNLAQKKHMQTFGDRVNSNVNINAGPSEFVYNAVNLSGKAEFVDYNFGGLINMLGWPLQGTYAADRHAKMLVSKAQELKRFGRLAKHPEKAIETFARFDWKEYAAEMRRIADLHMAVRK